MAGLLKGKKGFTLIELLVGVFILLIALSGTLLLFLQLMLLNESTQNLVIAANNAQYVLEEIRNLSFQQIANYTPPSFDNLPLVSVGLEKNITARLATVTVTVYWLEKNNARSFSLSSCFARE